MVKFQSLGSTLLNVIVYFCTVEHGCPASILEKIWLGLVVTTSYNNLVDLSFAFQVFLNFTPNPRSSTLVLAIRASGRCIWRILEVFCYCLLQLHSFTTHTRVQWLLQCPSVLLSKITVQVPRLKYSQIKYLLWVSKT